MCVFIIVIANKNTNINRDLKVLPIHIRITISCGKKLFVFRQIWLDLCFLSNNPLPCRTVMDQMITSCYELGTNKE